MTRREWLRKALFWGVGGGLFASAASIFGGVWLGAGRFSTSHWSQVVRLAELPAAGTIPFPQHRVALLRRGDKLAALSLECTHLGCLVNTVDQGFYCPCHGSEFGRLGEVYSGPAPLPLPWHGVRIGNGRIWIQSGVKLTTPVWVSLTGDSTTREPRA